jgi:hypothetical protein
MLYWRVVLTSTIVPLFYAENKMLVQYFMNGGYNSIHSLVLSTYIRFAMRLPSVVAHFYKVEIIYLKLIYTLTSI